MSEVFADSFCYIALLNPKDRFHTAALQATASLQTRIVTTGWVLMEVVDALSAPVIRQHTFRFLNQISTDANTTIIMDSSPWHTLGLALYGDRHDKDWSLTDCISFVIMAERCIAEALTGDHHFAQAGFRPLLQG
ncbi:MAG: hypothetical protein U0793_32710 [Gemmataceae bacterium]